MEDQIEDNEFYECTPPHLKEAAEQVTSNLLPAKSKHLYEKFYNEFIEWKNNQKAAKITENIVLPFFVELSKKYAPSSLLQKYSFLKSTLNLRQKVDIGKFNNLTVFMHRNFENYQAKKAKVLTEDEVRKFLVTATDKYFLTKVAFIFALFGSLRCSELKKLKIEHVDDLQSKRTILVQIQDTKTKKDRAFTIQDPFYDTVKRYLSLRPANPGTNELFLNYRHQLGKCTKQVVGKNMFSAMPKLIAAFLGLPSPGDYTGHSFRRTSATIASNGGADLTTIKDLGGWKSDAVAQSYIESSMFRKNKINNIISNQINLHQDESPPEVQEPDHSCDRNFITQKRKRDHSLSERNNTGKRVSSEASPSRSSFVSDSTTHDISKSSSSTTPLKRPVFRYKTPVFSPMSNSVNKNNSNNDHRVEPENILKPSHSGIFNSNCNILKSSLCTAPTDCIDMQYETPTFSHLPTFYQNYALELDPENLSQFIHEEDVDVTYIQEPTKNGKC